MSTWNIPQHWKLPNSDVAELGDTSALPANKSARKPMIPVGALGYAELILQETLNPLILLSS